MRTQWRRSRETVSSLLSQTELPWSLLATVPLGQKVSPFRKAAQNVRCTHTVWELDVSGSPRTVTPPLRPHWPSRLSSLTSRRSEEEGEVKKPRAKEKE